MGPRGAIREGLRDSFRFGGTMSRASYLWFLAAAVLAFGATLAVLHACLAPDRFWQAALLVTLVFYVPVTSAGARRLRDAGFSGVLMLRPLTPAAMALTLLWLLSLAAPGLAFWLWVTLLFAWPFVVLPAAAIALVVAIATLIAFSDTMSKLIQPQARDLRRPRP